MQRERTTTPVQVDKKIKEKVEKELENTRQTIGQFYDEAAIKKLKSKKKPTL